MRLDLLALFDWQLDNAPRHFEAHQALVRLNVAGERELIRRRRLLHEPRIKINANCNRCRHQNHNRDNSLHST